MLKKLKTWISRKGIKAVVFDYDGVLNDSLDVIRKLYNEFCRRGITNLYFQNIKEFSEFFQGDLYKNMEAAGMEVTEKNMELCNKVVKEFLHVEDPKAKLYPGIENLLLTLKDEGYKIGIASNGNKGIIKAKLKTYGLEHAIQTIIGYEEVNKPKPSPDVILKCLEELKVKPEKAVYVGDMESDVKAAKATGIKMIAAKYGYLKFRKDMHERLKGSHFFADDAEDIYIIIKNSKSWCKNA